MAGTTSATATWQVDVQQVTPDFIEGIHTLTNVPLNQIIGPVAAPASASAGWRFRIIYPR